MTVDDYSSGLNVRRHQNKLGSTLNAFTHFVYLFSQESTVPADLQSMFQSLCFRSAFIYSIVSTVVKENGDAVQMLFDIMTHTLDGSAHFISVLILELNFHSSSGVGDHGQAGISAFLTKHQCGKRCSNLLLKCSNVRVLGLSEPVGGIVYSALTRVPDSENGLIL